MKSPFQHIGDIVNGMQVIPTNYRGIIYRSRTEARWAVFFATLGVDAEYEPEGYVLDGIPYLPDFYVRDWDYFVEIKGAVPTAEEQEKCRRLALATGKFVIIMVGQPGSGVTMGFEPEGPFNLPMVETVEWDKAVACARNERFGT